MTLGGRESREERRRIRKESFVCVKRFFLSSIFFCKLWFGFWFVMSLE